MSTRVSNPRVALSRDTDAMAAGGDDAPVLVHISNLADAPRQTETRHSRVSLTFPLITHSFIRKTPRRVNRF